MTPQSSRRRWWLCALVLLASAGTLFAEPAARDGVLDLRDYDWNAGPVALDGEWDFFWGRYLESQRHSEDAGPGVATPRRVPGGWTEPVGPHDPEISRAGFGSYRLRVLPGPDPPPLGLKVFEIFSAYRLFIDGRLVFTNGDLERAQRENVRWLVRPYLPLPPAGEELTIVIEVANRGDPNPGPFRSLVLGPERLVRAGHDARVLLDFFSMGVLIAMGLYHLGLYFQRRTWISYLWFGLFSLVMVLRVLFTEEHYVLAAFPDFPVTLENGIDRMWLYLALPLMLAFIRSLFRREFPRLWFRALLIPSLGTLVVALLIPGLTGTIEVQKVLILGCILSVTAVLIRATLHRRSGAIVFLGGWLVFAAATVQDVLSHSQILGAPYIGHAGFLFFVISQAYFLSVQFTRALVIAENLAGRLDTRVRERTAKLNETLDTIHEDLQLARQVQEAAIGDVGALPPDLKVARHFLPMAEVGGDLFSIHGIDSGRVRVFLADAIGHGLQAALVTMTIKAEFEIHSHEQESPAAVLGALNDAFYHKHLSLTPYFTCTLVDIDLERGLLLHSSAGHPEQLLIRGGNEIVSLKREGPVIGLRPDANFGEASHPFTRGDRILMFSDGLIEQFNARGEIYGTERVLDLLRGLPEDRDLPWAMAGLLGDLHAFVGNNGVTDDVTLLGLEYTRD